MLMPNIKTIQLRDYAQEVRFLPILSVDTHHSKIELSGYCLPMDVVPVFRKFDHYVDQCLEHGKLQLSFNLIHFNTPSSKMIHVLLKRLERHEAAQTIEVYWYYYADDYEMQEAGEEFADLVPDLSFLWLAHEI